MKILVTVCWFYVKNYIIVHMIDKNFAMTAPPFGDP